MFIFSAVIHLSNFIHRVIHKVIHSIIHIISTTYHTLFNKQIHIFCTALYRTYAQKFPLMRRHIRGGEINAKACKLLTACHIQTANNLILLLRIRRRNNFAALLGCRLQLSLFRTGIKAVCQRGNFVIARMADTGTGRIKSGRLHHIRILNLTENVQAINNFLVTGRHGAVQLRLHRRLRLWSRRGFRLSLFHRSCCFRCGFRSGFRSRRGFSRRSRGLRRRLSRCCCCCRLNRL